MWQGRCPGPNYELRPLHVTLDLVPNTGTAKVLRTSSCTSFCFMICLYVVRPFRSRTLYTWGPGDAQREPCGIVSWIAGRDLCFVHGLFWLCLEEVS
jgi:hypothetical protein